MPDKPIWCGHLNEIAGALNSRSDPWIDRALLQELLGVGPRRAQQILSPCVSRRLGASGLAHRDAVLAHLERLASGETIHYEHRRRLRLAEQMETLYRERKQALLVPAPAAILHQHLEGLPGGISITPGCITVRFAGSRQALEKLLALAMAIRNDELAFERLATGDK